MDFPNFEINLNKSLSSFEEIFTPQFESVDMIDDNNNNININININNNQYYCQIHTNYKLSMVCVECTALVCPCCVSSLPIHCGHQHLEVDSDSAVFKKIYYCMTNCKDRIDNLMEIAMNEYENIRYLIEEKEINNQNINTQVEVFLDLIDLAIEINNNNNNSSNNNSNNNNNNNFNII
ncbi:expressed protein [Dictyostelium purpureum]|uniref:Expressed protein n=1 Tax=Dictyostelium purpureum TaxID=5786 RepID=F0ZCF0_DICPU|nr:uncharacterized protein DICPUDRAFT_91436 [Dictyostelium purpureum]EGC38337.1 expressed protein [Dictyostelium purpureum]|eukprot:XP_003285094.1 expressed protein [Dictyostelium purpureum]